MCSLWPFSGEPAFEQTPSANVGDVLKASWGEAAVVVRAWEVEASSPRWREAQQPIRSGSVSKLLSVLGTRARSVIAISAWLTDYSKEK